MVKKTSCEVKNPENYDFSKQEYIASEVASVLQMNQFKIRQQNSTPGN